MISVRDGVNLAFYGRPLTAQTLLLGDTVAPPAAAATLYAALDAVMDWASSLPRNGFMTAQCATPCSGLAPKPEMHPHADGMLGLQYRKCLGASYCEERRNRYQTCILHIWSYKAECVQGEIQHTIWL